MVDGEVGERGEGEGVTEVIVAEAEEHAKKRNVGAVLLVVRGKVWLFGWSRCGDWLSHTSALRLEGGEVNDTPTTASWTAGAKETASR